MKKLTDKQRRVREVEAVIVKIIRLEAHHDDDIVESACVRYKNNKMELKKADAKLEEAKRVVAELERKKK